MVALFIGIYVIEYKHVRVINSAPFPLALFCSEEFVKPFLISPGVLSGSTIISSRMSLVVFAVNLPFAMTTIRLKAVLVTGIAVKLACVFEYFAAVTLLHCPGL
jgi:hypothetical protein